MNHRRATPCVHITATSTRFCHVTCLHSMHCVASAVYHTGTLMFNALAKQHDQVLPARTPHQIDPAAHDIPHLTHEYPPQLLRPWQSRHIRHTIPTSGSVPASFFARRQPTVSWHLHSKHPHEQKASKQQCPHRHSFTTPKSTCSGISIPYFALARLLINERKARHR